MKNDIQSRETELSPYAEANLARLRERQIKASAPLDIGAFKGAGIILAVAAMTIWLASNTAPDSEHYSQTHQEDLPEFDPETGMHYGLATYVGNRMHDPYSLLHVSTQVTYIEGGRRITMIYRGKNAFGAKVINSITALVDDEGNLTEILTTD